MRFGGGGHQPAAREGVKERGHLSSRWQAQGRKLLQALKELRPVSRWEGCGRHLTHPDQARLQIDQRDLHKKMKTKMKGTGI